MRFTEPAAADAREPMTGSGGDGIDSLTSNVILQSTPEAPLTRRQLRELERRGQAPIATDAATVASATMPAGSMDAAAVTFSSADVAGVPVIVSSAPASSIDEQEQPTDESAQAPAAPSEQSKPVAEQTRTAAEQRRAAGRRAASPATRTPSTRTPGRRRRSAAVLRKVYSATALLFVGALVVGTTMPANAFRSESFVAEANTQLQPAAQELLVDDQSSELAAAAATSGRDEFSVTTRAQVLRQKYGTRNFSYATTGTGAVRWPFPYTVPVSSGYGERVSPCRGCSSDHKGIDLTPGIGSPIYAIADGIVTLQSESGGLGNHVYIEHVVNGQKVTSLYAHMKSGSSPLRTGDSISVGEFIGLVGSTGQSTGPHLHLGIDVNGRDVDPFVWLTANAS